MSVDCTAVIIDHVTGSTTSNLINAARRIKPKNGKKPEDFGDWHEKACSILSVLTYSICCDGRSGQVD